MVGPPTWIGSYVCETGKSTKAGIEEFFNGDEEGVHIDVEDGAGEGGLLGGGEHLQRIVAAAGFPLNGV